MGILNKFSRKLASGHKTEPKPDVVIEPKEVSDLSIRIPDKKERKKAYLDIINAVDLEMVRRKNKVIQEI